MVSDAASQETKICKYTTDSEWHSQVEGDLGLELLEELVILEDVKFPKFAIGA